MSGIHILDAYAVLELENLLLPGQSRAQAFQVLTQAVVAGDLVFPEAVLRDCRAFCRDEQSTVWLIAVAGSRQGHTFPGSMPMEILGKVPDLLAQDDTGDQSQVDVACLAHHLASSGYAITVVTEDAGLGGDRMTLGEACDDLDLDWCDLRSFLSGLGLERCCVAA